MILLHLQIYVHFFAFEEGYFPKKRVVSIHAQQ